ncbi:TRAP transporter large permease [Succinatimonas hippei]|uniref:TRAP transporter large permease n=1 Tax=Succinatimonas hippei TaxID=626938 RepID=UPI0020113485|nr:TRAP transporter large permease [Succinatimonas hippei]MCL1602708.1 TRAP transporter large permease [Succinatimonas hippei]
MASTVLLVSLAIFLILNMPVGLAIGLSTLAALLTGETLSLNALSQQMVISCDSFPILAVPLFILAGDLMGAGGVSRRILNVCNVFFGRITGGLAIVTVLVCMFFAAVSGSGPATVAAVGSMVIPTMIELGYKRSFVLALVATAGTIGVIIPPSIPMVLYGVSTGTSVTSLFMGGFFPGFLIGGALMLYSYIYCKVKGYKGHSEPFSGKKAWDAVWEAKWALINPIIILGGIYAGIFTPTEAAAIAALYAFICGAFIHRELDAKGLFKAIATSCCTTGTVMVILACATGFSKILTVEQVPQLVTQTLLEITDSKIVLLILINIMLLIVGCFMDQTPAILILAPILLPVAVSLGLDPVHFGLIMVANLAIGFITPPLGMALFVAARISNTKLEVVLKGIVPFIFLTIGTLTLITFIPQITMFLPNLMK